MKKNLFVAVILLIATVSTSFAFWPFGDLKLSNEVKNLKDSTEKNFSDIKAGVQDNKIGLNDIAKDAIKVNSDIAAIKGGVFTMNNKLDASLAANASIGQTLNTLTAGRDANSNSGNTNDSEMLKAIIKGILSTFSVIFLALIGYIKMLSNQKAKVEDQVNKMSAERDQQFYKLMADQQESYQKLVESKETYKSKYFELLEKDK